MKINKKSKKSFIISFMALAFIMMFTMSIMVIDHNNNFSNAGSLMSLMVLPNAQGETYVACDPEEGEVSWSTWDLDVIECVKLNQWGWIEDEWEIYYDTCESQEDSCCPLPGDTPSCDDDDLAPW